MECIPAESLIHVGFLARTLKNTVDLDVARVDFESFFKVGFGEIVRRTRQVRAKISENYSAARYTRRLGVNVYFGKPKFTIDTSVDVSGKKFV